MNWLPLWMDDVPSPLRALGWTGFRGELDDKGKWDKPPYQIGYPHRRAANNDPDTWRNEGDVREVQIMAPDLFDGFGVALTGGIIFVDLDDVRDPITGVIDEWALQLVVTFDSWAEVSVSGTGIHIFCFGRLPGSGLVGISMGIRLARSKCTTVAGSPI